VIKVVIKVDREFDSFENPFGLHTWSEFLQWPTEEEVTRPQRCSIARTTRAARSRRTVCPTSSRSILLCFTYVVCAGWKRVNVEELEQVHYTALLVAQGDGGSLRVEIYSQNTKGITTGVNDMNRPPASKRRHTSRIPPTASIRIRICPRFPTPTRASTPARRPRPSRRRFPPRRSTTSTRAHRRCTGARRAVFGIQQTLERSSAAPNAGSGSVRSRV